jgi:hypothetical protein
VPFREFVASPILHQTQRIAAERERPRFCRRWPTLGLAFAWASSARPRSAASASTWARRRRSCARSSSPKRLKSFAFGRKVLVAHERTKDLEPWWYIGKIKLYGVSEACKKACPSANFLVKYTKKETGSVLEGERRRGAGAHEGQLPITGATSGGSYSSRRRRERASWTVGVSCGVCAVQERSASALVRWPMPIGHMPHTPDTARFAKKSRLRTQLFNFRNWLS